jgi:hypothetical protein
MMTPYASTISWPSVGANIPRVPMVPLDVLQAAIETSMVYSSTYKAKPSNLVHDNTYNKWNSTYMAPSSTYEANPSIFEVDYSAYETKPCDPGINEAVAVNNDALSTNHSDVTNTKVVGDNSVDNGATENCIASESFFLGADELVELVDILDIEDIDINVPGSVLDSLYYDGISLSPLDLMNGADKQIAEDPMQDNGQETRQPLLQIPDNRVASQINVDPNLNTGLAPDKVVMHPSALYPNASWQGAQDDQHQFNVTQTLENRGHENHMQALSSMDGNADKITADVSAWEVSNKKRKNEATEEKKIGTTKRRRKAKVIPDLAAVAESVKCDKDNFDGPEVEAYLRHRDIVCCPDCLANSVFEKKLPKGMKCPVFKKAHHQIMRLMAKRDVEKNRAILKMARSKK